MSVKKVEKENLHPRNAHRARYDYEVLALCTPELGQFLSSNSFGEMGIDYQDPMAVKTLNQALLKQFYKIEFWDIPTGFLCPPVPGRADYIHYAADLLGKEGEDVPKGKRIRVLDIGTGANCIYPLLGHRIYGWRFTASETDPKALKAAQNLVAANQLEKSISLKKQSNPDQIFSGIITREDRFELSICNPPFHSSFSEAMQSSDRKWKNLGRPDAGVMNFGGTSSELYCEGGELQFISRMISESTEFKEQVKWFSCLVSKKENLDVLYSDLKDRKAKLVKTIEMSQGQKKSRLLAWTFQ